MTDYVKVSFSVTGKNTSENVYSTIIASLNRIEGINDVNQTSGTNTINVLAHWIESEVEEKLEEIRSIADVENVIIHNRNKAIVRGSRENVNVSEQLSFEIIKDPIGEVSRAKEDRDYFKAITYSCAVFEYYGKQILFHHFKEAKIQVDKDRLERLTLEAVIIMLYTHTFIDGLTYAKMFQVTGLRNKYMHRGRGIKYSPNELQKAENITGVGLDCLKTLKALYESTYMIN